LHTLFLENEVQTSKKNFRAMFLKLNEAHMPKFSSKNLGDIPARGLSIILFGPDQGQIYRSYKTG